MTSPGAQRARRTQAERSAATQRVLLDATIASLIEYGWSGTSARAIAERAGLSQGAQQHHYPTKVALVEAALDRVMRQFRDMVLQLPSPEGGERERAEELLDLLWQIHNFPLMSAVLEMAAAAKTDSDRPGAARVVATGTELTFQVAERMLPGYYARPGFRETLLTTLAVMRGTAIVSLPGAESAHLSWPVLRAQLLSALDALMD